MINKQFKFGATSTEAAITGLSHLNWNKTKHTQPDILVMYYNLPF